MKAKAEFKAVRIADFSCKLYIPAEYQTGEKAYPVIYINGEAPLEEIITELKKDGMRISFLMLSVVPENWKDDFSPWRAPPFRNGEEAPKGDAGAYILSGTMADILRK